MKITSNRKVEVGGFAIVLVAVWESFVRLAAVPQYLLPSPLSIAKLLISDAAYFFYHMTVTMVEAILGFLIATSVATLMACGFVLFRGVERIVLPYAIGLQAVPVVAIAPLLILWFGSGLASKIVMAAIICFFPMLINATRGLRFGERRAPEAVRCLRCIALAGTPKAAHPLGASLSLRRNADFSGACDDRGNRG